MIFTFGTVATHQPMSAENMTHDSPIASKCRTGKANSSAVEYIGLENDAIARVTTGSFTRDHVPSASRRSPISGHNVASSCTVSR